MEEVKAARRLAKNEGWDRVLPTNLSQAPKKIDDSIEKIQKNLDCLVQASTIAEEQIKKLLDPKHNYTGQIINTTPLVSPGVSVADAQLLRLQLGRFDVLWRQYRGRIFATTATVAEEDVQLGKLLEAALANLQRSYDRERSKRQGG